MKKYLAVFLLLFLSSCKHAITEENMKQWNENKASMKIVVNLLKENKLVPDHTNVAFRIPDSLKLGNPFLSIVASDPSNIYTLIFVMVLDRPGITEIVYTNNSSTIKDFNSTNEVELEHNWYFVSR